MNDARDSSGADPDEQGPAARHDASSSGDAGMPPMPAGSHRGRDGAGWPNLRTFRPGVIPLGPLGLGEILGGALATLRSHPALLFGASFCAVGISQVLALLLTWPRMQELAATQGQDELSPEQAQSVLVDTMSITSITMGFAMLAQLFVAGLATVIVGRAVLGHSVTFHEAWEELKPRLLPLLGLTLLIGIVVFVGVMLFLIPGVWAYVLLALATPALILERSPVLQAMRRSKDLVYQSWWRIFGILLLTGLIAMGINMLVTVPFEIIGGGGSAGGLESGATTTSESLVLSTIGAILAGTLAYPFTATVQALVYIDRRMRVEGLAVELARSAGMAPPDAGPPGTPHSW